MKLLFSTMLMFAGLAFTSCVDDNDDDGMPYIEVTPAELNFTLEGAANGVDAFTVKSNRPWTLVVPDNAKWVTPSVTQGKAGTSKVEFSIPANNAARTATLQFQLSNAYGAYFTKDVTVSQGDVVTPELVYKETFGTTDSNTPVASYTKWVKTGPGASTVAYTASSNVDLRATAPSAGYTGAGGGANLFFGTGNTDFTVQSITLPENVTGYRLTFGACYYGAQSTDVFSGLTIQFSADGATWSSVVPYIFDEFKAGTGNVWALAAMDFSLSQATSKLYIKFLSVKPADSNYRIDDVTLNTGNGGQIVEVGPGSTDPSVTTGAATNVTETGAKLAGTSQYITDATEVGVKYTDFAENIDWSTVTTKVAAASVSNSWSVDVTGLTQQKKYAYAAYAVTPSSTYYGVSMNFTTTGGSGSPDYILTDFNADATYPAGFPTGSSAKKIDAEAFVLDGQTYTIAGTSTGGYYRNTVYQGTGYYLLWGKQNGYIEFPAVSGKSLTKVKCSVPGAASGNVTVGVFDAAGTAVSGGEAIKWTAANTTDTRYYTYELSGTADNTKYRLQITNEYNAQLLQLELWYGDGGPATPSVTTANYSNLGETTATLGGSIANANLADYSAVGVEYVVFESGTPNWAGATKAPATTKATPWTVNVTGLTAQTQYAYRAYATPNSGDILYGDYKTLVTGGGSGGATPITIPNLLAKITATSAAEVIDATTTYTFEGIICGDPQAANASFGTLYVMTQGATTGGNGISLYNPAFWNDGNYKLGDKVMVTLTAGVAKGQIRFSIPQISDVGVAEVIVQSNGNTVTPIKVNSVAAISDYYNMPVTIQATTSAAGNWMDSEANTTRTITAGGANLAVYFNKNAWPTFQGVAHIATTAEITGIAAVYQSQGQLLPRNASDVANFTGGGSTTPNITSVNPTSLTWGATETAGKPVTVSGTNLNGLTVSTLTNFNASVSGTTVTVTPKAANAGTSDINETLTIYATGGNSITVPLKHSGQSSGGDQSVEINFSAEGYANAEDVTSLTKSPLTLTFAKETGTNAPKYYAGDSSVRVYAANTLTISGATITKVEYTMVSDTYNNFLVTTGTYTGSTWEGSANNLVFTSNPERVGGNFVQTRIQKVKITYQE